MEALGLITARGGSKGIPRKNLAHLAGRPLLAYTCDAALGSSRLTRVVLSTDDEEIAAVGRGLGVEVPFLRPGDLAVDDASSLDVVLHAIGWMQANDGWSPEAVVVLQPTSPLRKAQHLDRAVHLLETTGADTVVSVVRVPHQFNPHKVLQIVDGLLVPHQPSASVGPVPQRQAVPPLYARNGPAVLAVRCVSILCGQGFYGGSVIPMEMGKLESIDIDDNDDLVLAEALLKTQSIETIARADAEVR